MLSAVTPSDEDRPCLFDGRRSTAWRRGVHGRRRPRRAGVAGDIGGRGGEGMGRRRQRRPRDTRASTGPRRRPWRCRSGPRRSVTRRPPGFGGAANTRPSAETVSMTGGAAPSCPRSRRRRRARAGTSRSPLVAVAENRTRPPGSAVPVVSRVQLPPASTAAVPIGPTPNRVTVTVVLRRRGAAEDEVASLVTKSVATPRCPPLTAVNTGAGGPSSVATTSRCSARAARLIPSPRKKPGCGGWL